jgi:hypothetical protein
VSRVFGAFFVAVNRDRRVLSAGIVRLEQDYRSKERHAG